MTCRNDPCPCGSGKKYKVCCLTEITADPGFHANLIHIREARVVEKRRIRRETLLEPERIERIREDIEREAMRAMWQMWESL